MITATELMLTGSWYGRLRRLGHEWALQQPLSITSRLQLGAWRWAREAVEPALDDLLTLAPPASEQDRIEQVKHIERFLNASATVDFFVHRAAAVDGDNRGDPFDSAIGTRAAAEQAWHLSTTRLDAEFNRTATGSRYEWAHENSEAFCRALVPSEGQPATIYAYGLMRGMRAVQRMLLLAMADHPEQATQVDEKRSSVGVIPAPEPAPYGVSDEGAERLVATWMRHLGADDATVTRYSGDGGIDVLSSRYAAQVKNYGRSQTVGIASIRELHGVAVLEQRVALFFTSGQYPSSAIPLADRAAMALFVYDAEAGTLTGVNTIGRDLRERGLH